VPGRLQDPGLTVFPTHRLVRGLSAAQQEALAAALRRDFETEALDDAAALAPPSGNAVRSATSTRMPASRSC